MTEKDAAVDYFVSQLPKDSPEWRYYIAAFRIICSLELACTEKEAHACIMVLEAGADIEFKDGQTVDQDDFGGIESAATVVSVLFSAISTDPIWWKANYATYINNLEVRVRARKLLEEIKALEFVKSVHSYL